MSALGRDPLSKQQAPHLRLVKSDEREINSRINEIVKRDFDLFIATVALVVFTPVMILIAVAIRLFMSHGPILYKQERLTQGEKVFHILKFRTMVNNAEANTGPTWVNAHGDTRVTPLGKFLRKTHLDELPQLFNILRGEMSFIGPRPERPVFVEKFKEQGVPGYSHRHLTKTGITGYAQVLDPDPDINEIHKKTESDLWYIENWSLTLDCWIVWKTFLIFLNSFVELLLPSPQPSPGERQREREQLGQDKGLVYESIPVTEESIPRKRYSKK